MEKQATKAPFLSCETIGIPTALVLAIFDGVPLHSPAHALAPFLLSAPLSFEGINAIIEHVRRTDTADAYHMGKTFGRGALVDAKINWVPKPSMRAHLIAMVERFFPRGISADEEKQLCQFVVSIHFKRCKGVTRNPANPQHDILAVISTPEGGMKWFDITASNDPVMGRPDQCVPSRRNDCFAPLLGTKTTCHYCYNRFDRKLSKCGRCEEARYCDIVCQHADWKMHKTTDCVKK